MSPCEEQWLVNPRHPPTQWFRDTCWTPGSSLVAGWREPDITLPSLPDCIRLLNGSPRSSNNNIKTRLWPIEALASKCQGHCSLLFTVSLSFQQAATLCLPNLRPKQGGNSMLRSTHSAIAATSSADSLIA